MIDTDRYEGLTNDGKWRTTDSDDSVIYHDAERDWYATIALVQRDSDHYGSEDNPDMRLMADAPLLLDAYKQLREALIAVQQSLVWDEKDRAMNGDPITLEALVTQVEQVRSDITEMIE
tara:strand:- start:2504 stop:2860 length:357 start_codon:yes stop_codon:yes gene_type:complete